MQKKLIALAVAGALATPFAAAADSANVTIYGKMHYSWDFVDNNRSNGSDSSDDVTGASRQTTIGFKGSEDLGNGMKAVFQIEGQVDGGAYGSRNTFAGLAGDWGTVVMGRHDTPYKIATGSLDLFGDTIGDYNNIIGTVSVANIATGTQALNTAATKTVASTRFDERVPQTVAYISPNFNGFTGAIARVSAHANEASGNDETEAWSMMGIYSNGPLFVSLGYEALEDGAGALAGLGSGGNLGGAGANSDSDAWKLGLGYTFGDSKVGFVYEETDNDGTTAATQISNRDAWMINFAHNFGNNTVKIQYAEADDGEGVGNANTGADNWTIGIDHNFSKRTKVYALYSSIDNDANAAFNLNRGSDVGGALPEFGKDVDAFSFGLVHSF